ncbi:MAG TPA: hypothetical protein VF857_10915 [Spirochaetota bacterium]
MADTNFKEVIRSAIAILQSKDIDQELSGYKADTPEKEIALEYVNAYVEYVHEIAERDAEKARMRADYEIRELIGHVNAMLKDKQPELFMQMVVTVPHHYKMFFTKLSKEKSTAK